MMVAVLRWIIGSAEAATTTEQNDPVFQDARHFGGCQYRLRTHCPVAASIRSVDAAWIIQEQLSAAMDARPHSINTIPSRSNRRVEFEFIDIAEGMVIENLPPTSDRAHRPRRIYL